MLSRWGLIEETAPQNAVAEKLGLKVAKVQLEPQQPAAGIQRFIDDHPSELIVLGTHGREGIDRLLHGSIAETLSRRAKILTLFISSGGRAFVDQATGALHLNKILVPIDHSPVPDIALGRIQEFSRVSTGAEPEMHLLHVGSSIPSISSMAALHATPKVEIRSGDAVNVIVEGATDIEADLLALPTAGHHGFLDAIRGSTSERILRRAPCAVLAVPA
jgi:nucleotide-binding universal stress UspA family protein